MNAIRRFLAWLLERLGGPEETKPQIPAKQETKPRQEPSPEPARTEPAPKPRRRAPQPTPTRPSPEGIKGPDFSKFHVSEEHMIPLEQGQAVSQGWTSYANNQPVGVTWHWTATWDLDTCDRILGGPHALRKGEASAHYGIGLSFEEGVSRYVSLEDRSWHAGAGQTLRWDGKPVNYEGNWWSGARTTVGIEVVNVGYARKGVAAMADWLQATSPNGRQDMLIPPWPEEQIEMCIQVGKEILARWPHIKPEDHHGHLDNSPGSKLDPATFPFARVLREIYDDPTIPDIWTPFQTSEQRQGALVLLGYNLGSVGPNQDGVDGDWGRLSEAALLSFQKSRNMEQDGQWTTFVSREVYKALEEAGKSISEVENTPRV